MIDQELARQEVIFACGDCGHSWTVGYNIQQVEDEHGRSHEYYLHNGLPVVNPVLGHGVICARCGRSRIAVRLVAPHRTKTDVAPAGAP